ncbi:MAG: VTT domain-containing protein [Mariprofundaceae bacterium]
MDMELARQLIEQYGYLAVFLSTVIEGEVVVLAAAALASSGLLEARWVIVCAALGAYVGHLLLFAVGRWKGMALIEAVPALRRHYPKANMIMDRYANYSVFVVQYMYGMRLISAMLFGCSTISLPRFMLLESINCIIWALLAYFAGHLIGVVAVQLYHTLGLYGLLAVIGLILGAVALLYHRFGHHHVKAFLASGREPAAEQMKPVEGRHFLLEQLEYHIGLAGRNNQPFSLMLIRWSGANAKQTDSHEDMLTMLAGELCRFLRLSDIPARFSHDTLAVLAPGTSLAGAERARERLLQHLEKQGLAGDALALGLVEWQSGSTSGGLLDAAFQELSSFNAAHEEALQST